jgi:hypothetical protein
LDDDAHVDDHSENFIPRPERPPRYKLNRDALSDEEWNYFLGLFLTDGCADLGEGKWRCHRIRFYFQGNEAALSWRTESLLERLGLRPRTSKLSQGEDMIAVRVYSASLYSFLPEKRSLLDDEDARSRFFHENNLFTSEKGIPFVAGLLDGDGSCRVDLFRRRLGHIRPWQWEFSQSRCPFLVEYLKTFVDSLAHLDCVRVTLRTHRKSWSTGSLSRVNFPKEAILAMLKAGIAFYSWKAIRWLSKVMELQDTKLSYMTLPEVARAVGVSRSAVLKWDKAGKLDSIRNSHWFYVSVAELERFIKTRSAKMT